MPVGIHPPPSRAALDRNEAIARALLGPMLLVSAAPGVLLVQGLEAAHDEAAVFFYVTTPEARARVRLGNLAPSTEALAHTRGFSLSYQVDAPPPPDATASDDGRASAHATPPRLLAALVKLADVVRARDTGGASLTHPGGLHRQRSLRLVGDDATRLVRWSRPVFDARIEALRTAGAGPFRRAIAVVSQPCEQQCSFCPQVDRDKARDDWAEKPEADQLDDLLHQLARARELFGVDQVDLGGNDVLRFARVLDLANGIGELGYTRVIVQTTGLPLADAAFAAAISRSPVTEVHMPIYGSTPEVHDSITGTPGSFARLVTGVEHLIARGGALPRLHTIALASTLPSLDELITFCRDRFGLDLRVTPLRPNRTGEREHLIDTARLGDLRAIAAAHPGAFLGEFPMCLAPPSSERSPLAREPAGEARATRSLHLFDLGMVGREHDDVVRERSLLHPASCDGCAARDACPGVLASYVDQFGSDELTPLR